MPPSPAPPSPLPLIDVIIPAHNEARSIGPVLRDIPWNWVREVIVVDNASTDDTATPARAGGATVLREDRPGYGYACLRGMAHCYARPPHQQPDIIVFLDGDYSDYPEQLPELVRPILDDGVDMVIGSRALGQREPGAMLPQQIFGNWLATTLLRRLYGARFTDLGPFRAIRAEALRRLDMQDQTYGWTVEMQLKAAKQGLRCAEVPVRYRRRIGVSKVSGTVKGTLGAGYKILWTIFRYARG
ncbi:glycosyltransferase family 2 protein [Hymenobacter edaphi]|uniref:Glycosyltransferase family 2 protein n=1 Tax=Hymenobacter edaphi TaxID=2211146 RepID=A0A328BST8_9BACT|nr:glycosyltransferase family 2 protein [Hymenobacter edaphi]RAK69745.1 glycosyltransferase family 2 protein [Hymenobacter edaphi]